MQLYIQHVGQLQKIYAELLSTSNKRLSDLDQLHDFVQSATSELMWLNEREEAEVSRDWTDPELDLRALETYYEVLSLSTYIFYLIYESSFFQGIFSLILA